MDDPCNICGAPVTVVQHELPRRLGEAAGQTTETRLCSSQSCPSNDGRGRLGDSV